MSTILDRPLFKLLPAREPVMYANVTNAMEVSLPEKTVTHYIEVGAELFHLMKNLKVSPESKVLPFLDITKRGAIFGIMLDEHDLLDLWTIQTANIPSWVGDETHWSLAVAISKE